MNNSTFFLRRSLFYQLQRRLMDNQFCRTFSWLLLPTAAAAAAAMVGRTIVKRKRTTYIQTLVSKGKKRIVCLLRLSCRRSDPIRSDRSVCLSKNHILLAKPCSRGCHFSVPIDRDRAAQSLLSLMTSIRSIVWACSLVLKTKDVLMRKKYPLFSVST